MRTKDERIRLEIKRMGSGLSETQTSRIENILEAATALNMIYKVVRHFYILGKQTTSMFVPPSASDDHAFVTAGG